MYKRVKGVCTVMYTQEEMIQKGKEIYNDLISGNKTLSDLLEIYHVETRITDYLNAWFNTLDIVALNKCRNALAQLDVLSIYQLAKVIALRRVSKKTIMAYTGCFEEKYNEAKCLAETLEYYIKISREKDLEFRKQSYVTRIQRAMIDLGEIVNELLNLDETLLEISDKFEFSLSYLERCLFIWCECLPCKKRIKCLTILAKKRATPTFILAEKMAVYCKEPTAYRKDFKLDNVLSIIAEGLSINLLYYVNLRKKVSATNNNGWLEVPFKYSLSAPI